MLSRRASALLAVALLALWLRPARGQDDEPEKGLRAPEPMTVGLGDQFLGRLAPDGKTLVLVTNRDVVTEIFSQQLEGGRARPLFDEGADVTWPRISPDGQSLLYVSHRDRAAGQLCVRNLPEGGGRRCLDDGGSALQAEWIDARRVALVSRSSIEGDLRVLEVETAEPLTARPLLARNLSSPAVSPVGPGGQWLVYVPIERAARLVGPAFAARAGQRLEAVRLGDPAATPIPITVNLPGFTGQPAFSLDGRHLYFVQFFSDSNRDGAIDGRDHGVLFRVPFPEDPARIAEAAPEQLTDAAWNCQYPAPAADRLLATCSRDRDLDVYELPLDGEVPEDWDVARLTEEIDLSTERVQELLLQRHRLTREPDVTQRRLLTVRLVRLHLALGEFGAAEFYARSLRGQRDTVTRGLGQALRVLVEQRRAANDWQRGRMTEAFGEGSRKRLEKLLPGANDSPPALVLNHVIRSEIADDLGDKALARRELEAAAIGDDVPRSVLELYHERADALYRELDDSAALAAACRRLAGLRAFEPDEQLQYARAAVRAMTRGLPFAEADAALAGARASTPGDSELAFALDLGRAVLALRSEPVPREVRRGLVALYEAQTLPHRRRAVVLDAVDRAEQIGSERVVESLARAWLKSAQPGTPERRSAERLFRRAFTGRGYRRLAEGRLDKAREAFDAVVKETASLEAVVAAMDVRIMAGERPEAILAEQAGSGAAAETPLAQFVKAYLLARQLPSLQGEAHARALSEARAALRAARVQLGSRRLVRELQGALLHQQVLATGDLAAAERASGHYLVALEQTRNNPRIRALVQGQLGLLHARVGNHRIALRYLTSRERLPIHADEAGLAVRLATARALLHVGQDADAAAAADRALAMVDATPALAPYRALALDRAALCNLAAARFERALALYDTLVAILDQAQGEGQGAGESGEAVRNSTVARLARASAALGAGKPERALEDLAELDRALADPATAAALRSPDEKPEATLAGYRLLASGLRAGASRALGRLDDAQRALEERRTLQLARFAARDRDEDLQALTLAELQLAEVAAGRHDLEGAGAWLGQALGHADALAARTGAPVDPTQLDVLLLAAQLRALARAPLPFDLAARLEEANGRIARRGDPAFRSYLRWFEIYGTLAATPAP